MTLSAATATEDCSSLTEGDLFGSHRFAQFVVDSVLLDLIIHLFIAEMVIVFDIGGKASL